MSLREPPNLDLLAEAVSRYQEQQARQKRTTKEVAVRATKAASGPAIAVAIAVALSQIVSAVWGQDVDRTRASTDARMERAERAQASHQMAIEQLKTDVIECRASLVALRQADVELQAAMARATATKQRKGK